MSHNDGCPSLKIQPRFVAGSPLCCFCYAMVGRPCLIFFKLHQGRFQSWPPEPRLHPVPPCAESPEALAHIGLPLSSDWHGPPRLCSCEGIESSPGQACVRYDFGARSCNRASVHVRTPVQAKPSQHMVLACVDTSQATSLPLVADGTRRDCRPVDPKQDPQAKSLDRTDQRNRDVARFSWCVKGSFARFPCSTC